jgi:hypothetical protein
MANRKCSAPNDVIERMQATAAWRHKESKTMGHCVASDPRRSLRLRNDEKRTSYAMMTKTNGFWITLRERLLGQESEYVTPLVLQVYFWDQTGSLDNPIMNT